MEAPLCPVCGVREWRHLCSGPAASEIERRAARAAGVDVKRLPSVTKAALVVTKIRPAGKRGRLPLKGVAMSAAERQRRRRERLRGKGG